MDKVLNSIKLFFGKKKKEDELQIPQVAPVKLPGLSFSEPKTAQASAQINAQPTEPIKFANPLEAIRTKIADYFAPTPEVRTRDIIREIPGATAQVGQDILQSISRNIVSGMKTLGGSYKPVKPEGKVAEFFLGKEPVYDVGTRATKFAKELETGKYGVKLPTVAAVPIAAGLVIGDVALDMPGVDIPLSGGKKILLNNTDELATVIKNEFKLKPLAAEFEEPAKLVLKDVLDKIGERYTLSKDLVRKITSGEILEGAKSVLQKQGDRLLVNLNEGFEDVLPKAIKEFIAKTTEKKAPEVVERGVKMAVKEEPKTVEGVKLLEKPQEQKLLPGSYVAKTEAEAKKLFKKTGVAPEFRGEVKSTGKVINLPGDSDVMNIPPVGRGDLQPPKLDFTKWNDVGAIRLSRDTLERNIEKVVPKEQQQMVKDWIINPNRDNELARTKWLDNVVNTTKSLMNTLGIKKNSAEDMAIQRFGEGKMTAEELKDQLPNTWDKVVEADKYFRGLYDNILTQINNVRVKYGYEAIPKRENYYRHFQEMGDLMDYFGMLFGKEVWQDVFGEVKGTVPTNISGITQFFEPGKPFTSVELLRKGGQFTESAIGGFENYLNSVSRQIFHTDTVQRGRTLVKYIEEQMGNTKALPNFMANLREWVNIRAGKKSALDNVVEQVFGRPFLDMIAAARQRLAKNAVIGNLSSAITNTVPVTQILATTDKDAVVHGLFDTLTSPFLKDPSIIDGQESAFLKRTFGGDTTIDPTLLEKAEDIGGWMFGAIDRFIKRFGTASKYFEGLKNGLDEKAAMRAADDYAIKTFVERSVGETPNLFSSRSVGSLFPFQLEVNNILSFIKRDIPTMAGGDALKLGSMLAQFFVYSYFYNNLFEKATGRRVTLDPIHAGLTAMGMTDEAQGKPLEQRLALAGVDISEQLPIIGAFSSGGRLPISSVVPDISKIAQGQATLKDELIKTLTTNVLPFGGVQLRKTVTGLKSYLEGGVYNDRGQLKYPVDDNFFSLLQSLAFGAYSGKYANLYFKNEMSALTDKETVYFKEAIDKGEDPVKAWALMQKNKVINGYNSRVRRVMTNKELDPAGKQKEIAEINDQVNHLIALFDSIQDTETLKNSLSTLDSLTVEASSNIPGRGDTTTPDTTGLKPVLNGKGSIKTGLEDIVAKSGGAKLKAGKKGKAPPKLGGIKLDVSIKRPTKRISAPIIEPIKRPGIKLNYRVPEYKSAPIGVRLP